jgi:hypothetical protein
MGDLRKELARLRELTPELNAATDRATKLALAIERFLGEECQFGIPAYVEFDQWDNGQGVDTGKRLEYERVEGKFRLTLVDFERYQDGEYRFSDQTLWVSATRDRKLGSIEVMPKLLDRIAEKVAYTIKEANKSAEVVEAYLKDLGVSLKEGK